MTRKTKSEAVIEAQLAVINRLEKLEVLYKKYIELLGEELKEVVPIAVVHRWESTRYEAGVKLRKKIKELQEDK